MKYITILHPSNCCGLRWQMDVQTIEQVVEIGTQTRKEYDVVIDGVIAIPSNCNDAQFFDGLFDAILEYVEKYEARAVLSIMHKEYVDMDDDIEADDGEEVS